MEYKEFKIFTDLNKYGNINITLNDGKLIFKGPLGYLEKSYKLQNLKILKNQNNVLLIRRKYYFGFLKELEKFIVGVSLG